MRTAIRAVLVTGAVFSSFPAVAGEGSALRGLKPPQTAIQAAQASLSGEPALRWRDADAVVELAPRLTRYGATVETRHYSLGSTNVRTALQRPYGQGIALRAGTTDSLLNPLPRYTVYRQVQQSLGRGWGLGAGVRQSNYGYATNSLYSVTAERYIGNFRGAYTLYSSRTEGSDLGSAQRVQLSYLYGERNTIGLSYTTGRDIDNLVMPPGVAMLGDSRDVSLSGRHWLSTNWALTYDVLSHEQPTLARRQGLRLGVSRSF
jgi:YaiO family outer membrane protein